MLRVITILLTIVLVGVQCHSNVGTYVDRPDLVEDHVIKDLALYAGDQIEKRENRVLDHIKLTRVQMRTTSGMKYKLDFTAQSMKDNYSQLVNCQATIYIQIGKTMSVVNAQCESA